MKLSIALSAASLAATVSTLPVAADAALDGRSAPAHTDAALYDPHRRAAAKRAEDAALYGGGDAKRTEDAALYGGGDAKRATDATHIGVYSFPGPKGGDRPMGGGAEAKRAQDCCRPPPGEKNVVNDPETGGVPPRSVDGTHEDGINA